MRYTQDDERVMVEVNNWFSQNHSMFKLTEYYGIDICGELYNLVKTCMNNEQCQSIGPCACMGPQGNDPVCPCVMRQRGLEPTDSWPLDEVERLHAAMNNYFRPPTQAGEP